MKALTIDALCSAFVLALVALLATSRAREGGITRLGLRAGRLDVRRAIVLIVGLVALSQALDSAIAGLGLPRGPTLDALNAAVEHASLFERAVLAAVISVPAAIAEELLARGWLQRAFVPRFGVAPGIVLASAAFGALHGHPVHGAAAFVLGLWLGWIAWRADSVRPAIVAHAVNNAIAVLALGRQEAADHAPAAAILAAIVAAGVVVLEARDPRVREAVARTR